MPGASDDEALRLAADLGPTAVVLKQGSAGVIGTDGAGDAFDAGFLAGHLAGWDLADAMWLGAALGAAAVAQPGDHAWSPEGIVSGVRGRRPG